jgi:hypothetical protein
MDALTNSPTGRRRNGRHRDPQRSRITNGSLLPAHVDERSAWARRCKDIIAAHLSDLGDASTAERSIVRRAAVLTVELEQLECRFASAGNASERELDLYQRGSNSLRRLLQTLGLQRRPRDVTPSLHEIMREHTFDLAATNKSKSGDADD